MHYKTHASHYCINETAGKKLPVTVKDLIYIISKIHNYSISPKNKKNTA